MNPVDLLGTKISVGFRIGMTHPYIKKSSPLSLLETLTVDVGLVSPIIIIIVVVVVIIIIISIGNHTVSSSIWN